jgi:acetyl-CoA synthetase
MTLSADLRDDGVFWNLSDTAWGYGLWFGVVGALLLGRRMILRPVRSRGHTRCGRPPQDHKPHGLAYRVPGPAGPAQLPHAIGRLRVISTAGEPLNPGLLTWSQAVFGTPIHDHYG